MNIDEMPAGREMDALVGNAVFGWPIIWLQDLAFPDDPKWHTPYFWDKSAKKTSYHSTQASLVGGYWLKGITDDDETIEIFGRLVPAYSNSWACAGNIVEHLHMTITPNLNHPRAQWCADTELKGPNDLWLAGDGSVLVAICRAAFKAVQNSKQPR